MRARYQRGAAMIPRLVHFVFGLREQREPFHFLHYVSLESCRRMLEPEAICFHHRNLPWGPWWDRIRPHLTLIPVAEPPELSQPTSSRLVPPAYLYAHQADFVRLDALIEHGGVYADIDTIFLRPFSEDLYEAPFVIGRESPVADQITGEVRPSLCNALLMSEPGAQFAQAWRERMAGELNGTWSNHSGFLSQRLSELMPEHVRVEPEVSFYPFASSREGLAALHEESRPLPASAYSVHLWAHLWWERARGDFSAAHSGWYEPCAVRLAHTTLAELARPYLAAAARAQPEAPCEHWAYISLDEHSGYGESARRCMAALDESGVGLEWTPLVPGRSWGLGYQPAITAPLAGDTNTVIAHVVPEYLPLLRANAPEALLIAQTVWDTDRRPRHWGPLLEHADLVVVPSRFSVDGLVCEPLGVPIEVVPHVAWVIDERAITAPTGIPDDVLVFYTIGEWTERKDIARTVQAFLEAFTARDPVMLIIKTSPADRRIIDAGLGGTAAGGPGSTAGAVAHLLAGRPDAPEVKLITRSLSAAEVAGLHHRGDCFVSLCRSEGWGLGAFDAAVNGNPVVMTGYGGQLDYLSGSPHLVGYELVPVRDPTGNRSYTPDQHWGEADVSHGAALLLEVAKHHASAKEQAMARALELQSRFSPEAVADRFRRVVAEHRPRSQTPRSSDPEVATR